VNKIWKADTPLSLLIYYLAGLIILVGAHHLSPTNLAGPGLDIPAFFIYFVLCFVLFIKTFLRVSKMKRPLTKAILADMLLSYTINFVGVALLILLFTAPANWW